MGGEARQDSESHCGLRAEAMHLYNMGIVGQGEGPFGRSKHYC